MVATLLRLRFRALGNQLSRSPWQLVGFIFGAIYGVGLLVGIVAGLVVLGFTDVALAGSVIVAAGSLVTLGWALVPLLAFGVDTTLDPERLVVFPMSLSRMMVALALAGVTGIPGIITSAAALATIATWAHWPAAILAWLLSIPLAVLTAVVASRVVATLASGIGGAGRRFRELAGILIFIPLILAGPIIAGVATGFSVNAQALTALVPALGWTPLGAAWAVPADAAAGDFLAAAAKLAIAIATLAALWLLWRMGLGRSLVQPRQRSTGVARAGSIGWFGRVPTGAAGAVFARALTYWTRDPRYLRQLVGVPLVPVLLWFYARSGDPLIALTFSGPIIAMVIGIVVYADISYDGTAFGSEVITGAPGRSDRLGRTLAAAAVAVPLVLLAVVLPFAFSGDWAQLPGILGMSLGILFTCYGVCAVTSAQLVVPVAASGDNPFKRVPGTTFLQGMAFLGIWLVAVLLSAPAIVVGLIGYFTASTTLSWIAGVVGVVLGAAVLVGGILIGGRMLDRSAPVLLARLKAMKNA
jgi:ABC-2 type transport system permease protein